MYHYFQTAGKSTVKCLNLIITRAPDAGQSPRSLQCQLCLEDGDTRAKEAVTAQPGHLSGLGKRTGEAHKETITAQPGYLSGLGKRTGEAYEESVPPQSGFYEGMGQRA